MLNAMNFYENFKFTIAKCITKISKEVDELYLSLSLSIYINATLFSLRVFSIKIILTKQCYD